MQPDPSNGTGVVTGIYITDGAGQPMRGVDEVAAVAGAGLDADRYLRGTGFYSARPREDGGREVTFIAEEAVAAAADEAGVVFEPHESRRNIVTRGIDLNELVGLRVRVGSAAFDVVDLCTPCAHLEEVTGKPVMRALLNRGGLRTRIHQPGVVQVGDVLDVIGPIPDAG